MKHFPWLEHGGGHELLISEDVLYRFNFVLMIKIHTFKCVTSVKLGT